MQSASYLAVRSGLSRLPRDLMWRYVAGAGRLGGIRFRMAIYFTNLAFAGELDVAAQSKIAELIASLVAGATGYVWLRITSDARRAG